MIPSGTPEEKGNGKASLCQVATNGIVSQRRIAGWAERQALSDVEEVAHSQSLHLTNLQKAMRLRVVLFLKPKMYDGPSPLGGSCLDNSPSMSQIYKTRCGFVCGSRLWKHVGENVMDGKSPLTRRSKTGRGGTERGRALRAPMKPFDCTSAAFNECPK
jgi:hypothetical protein